MSGPNRMLPRGPRPNSHAHHLDGQGGQHKGGPGKDEELEGGEAGAQEATPLARGQAEEGGEELGRRLHPHLAQQLHPKDVERGL